MNNLFVWLGFLALTHPTVWIFFYLEVPNQVKLKFVVACSSTTKYLFKN